MAGEYTKLKQKNTILKRAVMDERKRVELLEVELQSKNKSLRKHVSEVDSLNFSVQSLTKRCEKLRSMINEESKKQVRDL